VISRALFFEGPRRIAVRDVTLPAPAAGEVRVRALASAISQGTELLLYRGEGPEPFDPSVGAIGVTYPRRYGYAWVGSVLERGPAVPAQAGAPAALEEGTRVFALAPHGDAHVLGPGEARRIREDIPAARAALAANLETAVTCAWDAETAIGERVVVLGAGVVGILVAWLLVRGGADVTLIDPGSRRRAAAHALVPTAKLEEVSTPDARADVVIEATGDPRALDHAIAWAAPSARIVVASFYGRRRAPIDLGDAFHRRRLTLVASQVSSIPPRLSARWDAARRFALVEDLLGEPNLDALLAPAFPFERAAELYEKLDGEKDTSPCHVFDYG
jgi:2-desacetyl-2-hydroxyethyl bacteriochlorophyllide A dehydrogenase